MKSEDISTIKKLYNSWYSKSSIRSLISLFEKDIASILGHETNKLDINTIIIKWVEYLLDHGKLWRYLTSWLQRENMYKKLLKILKIYTQLV